MSSSDKYPHHSLNVKPFDGTNFTTWKTRVTAVLEEHGLVELLYEEKAKKPAPSKKTRKNQESGETEDDAEFIQEEWKRRDAKAKSILIQCIADSHLSYIAGKPTAKKMWDALRTNFERKSLTKQILTLKKLINMRLKPNGSLMAHLTEFESTLGQYRNYGGKMDEFTAVVHLFVTLPVVYESVVASLETVATLEGKELTLDMVRARLEDQESKLANQNAEKTNQNRQSAFVAKKEENTTSFPFMCHYCGIIGHKRSECMKKKRDERSGNYNSGQNSKFNGPSQSQNSNQYSSSTNSSQSTGKTYEKPGSEKKYSTDRDKQKPPVKKEVSSLASASDPDVLFMCSCDTNVDDGIYLDSGASKHMFKDEKWFVNLKKLDSPIIIDQAGEEDNLFANEIGLVRVASEIEGKVITCDFENVLFVRGLRKNLISVSQIDKKGGVVRFGDRQVSVYANDKIVLSGKAVSDGLYEIDCIKSENCFVSNSSNSKLWHRRLGHPGYSALKKTIKLVEGINLEGIIAENPCDVCVKAKQTALPHNKTRKPGKRPLDIVHMDLVGPMETVGIYDEKYILVIVDDYTKFTMAYPIESKSETFNYIRKYEALVTAKFGTKIARIRCDNGGEFISNDFRQFCDEKGIEIDYSVPYVHELNGTVERKNRTLMEKVRALLIDSKLPKYLWPEATKTAAYLSNRTSTETLQGKTPAEMWNAEKPDLKNLRIYGSAAYVHVPNNLRKKLDEKSQMGYLVGYSNVGYRIWHPVEQKITVACDVIFDETKQFTSNILRPEPVSNDQYDGIENVICHSVTQSNFDVDVDAIKIAKIKEIEAMKEYKVWEIVDRPKNEPVISCKWDVRVKPNGEYKARLVARGFEQKEETYQKEDSYSPVVKTPTLKALLSVANKKDLECHHVDINTAFLNAPLKEGTRIFMEQPPELGRPRNEVCLLKKAIYGLRQSPKRWNECLHEFLMSLGFERSLFDPCLYTLSNDKQIVLYLIVYVDDMLIVGKHLDDIEHFKLNLAKRYAIKDLGVVERFIGIRITRDREQRLLYLDQTEYINQVVARYNLTDAKSESTPMECNLQLTKEPEANGLPFRELIGSILFIMNGTRPDISFAANYLSRFRNNYGQTHF